MGVDSTAILLRWLHEPSSRGFALRDLTVITAMTGNEFAGTARQVRRHIIRRLRDAGVRFVQVARGGLSETAGAVVLDDSTVPRKLHFDGCYPLIDEWRQAATLQTSGGIRKCSLKFKGWVIDRFLSRDLDGAPFVHVIGFNADELRRVEKDQVYGSLPGRDARYPLVEWGWGREECERYIQKITGEIWLKSACAFCPFAGQGCERDAMLQRWSDEPERAAWAVEVERVALAFNPRMLLFKTRSVEDILRAAGNTDALRIADERLDAQEWAVYRLRRAMKPRDDRSKLEKQANRPARWNHQKRGATFRSVSAEKRGLTREQALRRLSREAKQRGLQRDGWRVVLRDSGDGYPRIEEALVAAPAYVADKHGRYGAEHFDRFYGEVEAMWPHGIATPTRAE
jgi:hypothetical protein